MEEDNNQSVKQSSDNKPKVVKDRASRVLLKVSNHSPIRLSQFELVKLANSLKVLQSKHGNVDTEEK